MKGLFIPEITTEMFRNGCLESVEELMAEGEIYDIEYSRWIPVSSKRMPKNSGNYLITYCLRDKIETQEAVYVKDEDKWFDITDIEITLAVIAWMPLPSPYTESEEV